MKKNEIYTVEIESSTIEAMGVARIEGFVTFVAGAVEGEICSVKILKVGKNCAWAKAEEIIEPSLQRRESECPFFPKCGGCSFWHMSYEQELKVKRDTVDDVLKRIGLCSAKSEKIIPALSLENWRNKALFPVSEENGLPVAGFYRNRSHQVIPIDHCMIQADETQCAVDAVLEWMKAEGIHAYTSGGIIRHIYVRSAKNGDKQVCVVASKDFPGKGNLVSLLKKRVPKLKGVLANINSRNDNVILGNKYVLLWGAEYLTDELCGLKFKISPASFYQVNHDQAENLYRQAMELADIKPHETVLDLYCGIGTITLCIAQKAKKVIGAEIVERAIVDARENALMNNISNAEFFCGDAAEVSEMLLKNGLAPDAVFVDPPRKGLTSDTIENVCKMQPKRIVYVSCDPATMARDILVFEKSAYKCSRVVACDMFPRTGNVETVVLLVKKTPDEEIKACV